VSAGSEGDASIVEASDSPGLLGVSMLARRKRSTPLAYAQGRKAETVDQRLVQVRSYSRRPEVDTIDTGRLHLTVGIVCDIWASERRMDSAPFPSSRNSPLPTVSTNDLPNPLNQDF
jgi:hypothetical protein